MTVTILTISINRYISGFRGDGCFFRLLDLRGHSVEDLVGQPLQLRDLQGHLGEDVLDPRVLPLEPERSGQAGEDPPAVADVVLRAPHPPVVRGAEFVP